jgi:hypothetical protein
MATKKTKTPRDLAKAATGGSRSRAQKTAAPARAPRETSIKFQQPGLGQVIPLLERLAKSQEETVEIMRSTRAAAQRPRAFALTRHEALCALLSILRTGRVSLVAAGSPIEEGTDDAGDLTEDVNENELVLTFSVGYEDADAKAFMHAFGREAATELMRGVSSAASAPTGSAIDEPQTDAPAPLGDQPEDGAPDGDDTVSVPVEVPVEVQV